MDSAGIGEGAIRDPCSNPGPDENGTARRRWLLTWGPFLGVPLLTGAVLRMTREYFSREQVPYGKLPPAPGAGDRDVRL